MKVSNCFTILLYFTIPNILVVIESESEIFFAIFFTAEYEIFEIPIFIFIITISLIFSSFAKLWSRERQTKFQIFNNRTVIYCVIRTKQQNILFIRRNSLLQLCWNKLRKDHLFSTFITISKISVKILLRKSVSKICFRFLTKKKKVVSDRSRNSSFSLCFVSLLSYLFSNSRLI